ncbi:MAG: hypothetical protein CSA31_01670 [Desulfobulbus propionicus]|nr:MAG: hypothetical protein CSA31_01670 [Desulfobulbus propionicus]
MAASQHRFFFGKGHPGFTLLEVLIAVAVLSLATVTLLGAQSQSIPILSEARFLTTASMLAQEKLSELEFIPFSEIDNDSGDFGEDFASFTWAVTVSPLDEEETGLSGSDEILKSVLLTVSRKGDERQALAVQTIFLVDIEADESSK